MKKLFFNLFISFIWSASFAQTKNSDNVFAFIDKSADTSSLKFIQTFRCISKKGDDITSLYRAIKNQAQYKGSNCFIYKSFSKDSSGVMTLTLDTYYGDDAMVEANFNNYESNTIYIISDGDFDNKLYSFNINGEKKVIKSGTYFKYVIQKGEKVTINKGGFFGSTAEIHWGENKPSQFFTLSGFGFSDIPLGYGSYPISGPGVGVSFTTGKIKSVDRAIGYVLKMILKNSE